MKKVFLILSLLATSLVSYSAVSTVISVDAKLTNPLELKTNTSTMMGSVNATGGTVKLSEVELTAMGVGGEAIQIKAPKDIVLKEAGTSLEVTLQSDFSTGTTVSGTDAYTDVVLNGTGTGKSVYTMSGLVPALTLANGQANAQLEGTINLEAKYN